MALAFTLMWVSVSNQQEKASSKAISIKAVSKMSLTAIYTNGHILCLGQFNIDYSGLPYFFTYFSNTFWILFQINKMHIKIHISILFIIKPNMFQELKLLKISKFWILGVTTVYTINFLNIIFITVSM